MSWATITAQYQQGICQVCGNKAARFFCEEHRDQKVRPPREEWYRVPVKVSRETTYPQAEPTEPVHPEVIDPPPSGPGPARPRPPRQGVLGRLFNRRQGSRPTETKAARPKPRRRPKLLDPGGPRRAGAVVLGDGWESLGEFLTGSPFMAAGRVMTFQGEAAGAILDDALKGTVVDKMALQPYIAAEERYGAALRLISLPVQMQMVISKWQRIQELQEQGASSQAINAQAFQFQWQVRSAKKSIRKSLPELAKASKRQRESREKSEQVVREAWPELENQVDEAGNPIDPVDVLFNEILGPMFAAPPPQSPQPEGTDHDNHSTNGNGADPRGATATEQPGHAPQPASRTRPMAP
jgi:hypothetical protein